MGEPTPMNTDEIIANMEKRISVLEHHCHPLTGHAATYTGDVEPCYPTPVAGPEPLPSDEIPRCPWPEQPTAPASAPAPDCRKDVGDAWRNCPILADSLVHDIYRTATDKVLCENDFKAVSRVISLAYHLGRVTERKPSDVAPDDDAEVHQIVHLVRNHLAENTSLEISQHFDTCCARVITKAIRTGQLPGVWASDMQARWIEVNAIKDAEIAALKAELEISDHWRRFYNDQAKTNGAELDKALARVTELETALDATHKRFSEEVGNVYQLRSDLASADECAKKANDEHSRTRARLVDESDQLRADLADKTEAHAQVSERLDKCADDLLHVTAERDDYHRKACDIADYRDKLTAELAKAMAMLRDRTRLVEKSCGDVWVMAKNVGINLGQCKPGIIGANLAAACTADTAIDAAIVAAGMPPNPSDTGPTREISHGK